MRESTDRCGVQPGRDRAVCGITIRICAVWRDLVACRSPSDPYTLHLIRSNWDIWGWSSARGFVADDRLHLMENLIWKRLDLGRSACGVT